MKRLFLVLLLCAGSAFGAGFNDRPEVLAFIDEMASRHDLDRAWLARLFHQARPIPSVIKAIMPPSDPGVRSWQAYRSRFIEPRRIAAGRNFMQRHAEELRAAESHYGVPAEVIAAIIGVETIYGRNTGRFGTFAALATLAFGYPPRADLFRRELEELLLLAREERRNPLSYRGSYAGALGMPQFLPSSRRRFGVDFDGDGRIDLAGSAADAIGSVANFLAAHGWESNAPVAIGVWTSGDGLQALIDEGIVPRRSPREWTAQSLQLGPIATDGKPVIDELPDSPAALIDLATPNAPTEYRVGYRNFFVITRYNRSSFYAAVVTDLAAILRESKQ